MSEDSLLDFDDVLEMSLGDVEEAPDYITPPDGVYILSLVDCKLENYKVTNEETKAEENRKRIKHTYAIVKTLELAKPEEELVPADGSLFTEQWMLNDQGLKYWKRCAHPIIGDSIGKLTVREAISELAEGGFSFKATVKIRRTKDKTDKNKEYQNVQVRVIDLVTVD